MRQAVTTMLVGLSLALSPVAQVSARATDAAATIAQARRLIEATDYSSATILLEDLLPEADANDRRSILELLRQSYQAMARQAKAAGNDREAAHLQDNIAIINQARGVDRPAAKATEGKTKIPPASTKPAITANTTSDATGTTHPPLSVARSQSLPASAQGSSPESPPEPAPRSQPKIPALETLPRLPKNLESSNPSISDSVSTPSSPPLARSDAGRDQGKLMGSAQRDAAAIGSTGIALESSVRRGEANTKPPEPSLKEGDRLFTAGRYDEAGRCYAALARENRLPAHRNVHWAYCRMVGVAQDQPSAANDARVGRDRG